jgi:hypothetical protein
MFFKQIMEDIRVKLSTALPWQKLRSTRGSFIFQKIGPKFEEETSKMLHLQHGFVWC